MLDELLMLESVLVFVVELLLISELEELDELDEIAASDEEDEVLSKFPPDSEPPLPT